MSLLFLIFSLELTGAFADSLSAEEFNQLAWDSLNSNLEKAEFYANRAYEIANSSDNFIEVAKSLNRLGLVLERKELFAQALRKYQESLKLRRSIDNKDGIANNFLLIGNIYRKRLILDSAILYYDSCRDYALSGESLILQYKALDNIALVYKKMNRFNKAKECLIESINLQKQLTTESLVLINEHDMRSITNTLINLGILYALLNTPDSALINFKKALSVQQKLNDKQGMARVINNIANLYYESDMSDSAIYYYRKSVRLKSDLKNKKGIVTSLYNIAVVQLEQNQLSDATLTLDSAKKLCIDNFYLELLNDITWKYVEIFELKGEIDAAFIYLKQYTSINDSLNGLLYDQKIAEQEVKFDTKSKEFQNRQLKLDAIIHKKQLNILIISLIGTGAILLFAIMVLWFYWYKRIKEKIIAQQKIDQLIKEQELKSLNAMMEGQESERTRIAEDLHDRLGSILSTVKMYFSSIDDKMTDLQDQSQQQYQKAKSLLTDAISEVRNISQNMVSGVLINFGLKTALQDLVDTIEGSEKIQINLIINNLDERIKNRAEINVYRIVQELLSNTLKYARASQVVIQLHKHDHLLNLMIEDDGLGFDTKKIEKTKGMGLKNVQKRVNILNGKITIDSHPGKGTTVTITDLVVD